MPDEEIELILNIKEDLKRISESGKSVCITGPDSAGATTAAKSLAHPDCLDRLMKFSCCEAPTTYLFTNDQELPTNAVVLMCEMSVPDPIGIDGVADIMIKMHFDATESCRRDKSDNAQYDGLSRSLGHQMHNAVPGTAAYPLKFALDANHNSYHLIKAAGRLDLDLAEFALNEAYSGASHNSEDVEKRFAELLSKQKAFPEALKEFQQEYRIIIERHFSEIRSDLEKRGAVEQLPSHDGDCSGRYRFMLAVSAPFFPEWRLHRGIMPSDVKIICRGRPELFDSSDRAGSSDIKKFASSFVNGKGQEVQVWRIADTGSVCCGAYAEQDVEHILDILSKEQSGHLIYVQDINRLQDLCDRRNPLYRFLLTAKRNTDVRVLCSHLDEFAVKHSCSANSRLNGGGTLSADRIQNALKSAEEECEKVRTDLSKTVREYNRAKTKPDANLHMPMAGHMIFPEVREALWQHSYPEVMTGMLTGIARHNSVKNYPQLGDRFRVPQCFAEKACRLDISQCGGSYNIKKAYDGMVAFKNTSMHQFTEVTCYNNWLKYGISHQSRDKTVNTFFVDYLRNFFNGFHSKFVFDLSLISTDGMTDEEKAETLKKASELIGSQFMVFLGRNAMILLGEEADVHTGRHINPRGMAGYLQEKYFRSNTVELSRELADIINEAGSLTMAQFVREFCISDGN